MRAGPNLAALLLALAFTRPVFADEHGQLSAACAARIRNLEAMLREGDERAPFTSPFMSVKGLQPPKAGDGEA